MTLQNPAPDTGPAPTAQPASDFRGILQRLREQSPTFRDFRPLALRIDTAIMARFPEFERKALRSALHFHTATTRYLKEIQRSPERFDLDGNVSGEVTEEQRAHAATLLKERFAAAARSQREKRKAEEAARLQTEKLQQLVTRFSK